jgi:hypothetical protein
MANQDQSGNVRQPQPGAAAQDERDASAQQQVHADSDASRAEADRVRASTPPDIRNKTVGQIVEEAARRAQR